MFARHVFRAAQPLRQSAARRCYASGPAASSSNTLVYSLLGAGALGGGYVYYTNYGPGAAARARGGAKTSNAEAPPSPAEQHNVSASAPPSASAPQAASNANGAFTGGEQGFIDLKLDSVEEINHNTKKFRFALPNADDVSGLQIASALLTKYKGPGMEKPAIRPYTPTSDEDQRGYIDLLVKRYEGGVMSEHLHNMTPGHRLDFKGPVPKYPWTPNKHEHVALIAGGTGITPMYQLARAITSNPADKTKITLVYANISEPDILLKQELHDLENTYPQRFRAFYTLDNPPKGWMQGKGFVSRELLKTLLPEPKKGEGLKIFVCGPPGFYRAVSGVKEGREQGELGGALAELGYGREQVYKF